MAMHKFLFDHSFDEKETRPEEGPLPGAERESLRKEGFESGYARGFQEGLSTAAKEKDAAREGMIRDILETVTYTSEELAHQRYTLGYVAAQTTRQILAKLFPHFVHTCALTESEHFITELMGSENPPEMKIVGHPQTCAFLKETLLEKAPYATLTFEGDASFAEGDVRASWGERGVERIQEKILNQCLDLLQHLELSSEPPLIPSPSHRPLPLTIQEVTPHDDRQTKTA